MRVRLPAAVSQAGLGVDGLKTIYGFTLLAAGRALALVLMAEAVASGIASVVAGSDAWHAAIVWGIVGAVLRAGIAWGTRTFAARSAIASKEALRRDLARRLMDQGGASVGSLSVLGTHGLDELDNYYRSVLPAITSAAVIPIVIGARLLFADWSSALIIAVTIILVPLFMALIGIHTDEKVSAASAALARLSDHLVELARGLPVLVGLGRAEDQLAALKSISDDYRAKTMKTLRVAFMSSLALELISTISVAVVAVSIGLRLVYGDLGLDVALLVLILAPECFTPFRDLGASFHAAQDGLAALSRARAIIDSPVREGLASGEGAWRVERLTVRFADREVDAVHALSFDIPRGRITALQGMSGSGKSTVLNVLAGQLFPDDDVVVTGTLRGLSRASVAWLPQHPHFVADTVRGELELYAEGVPAPAKPHIDILLRELGLQSVAESSPEQLSPGEARRLAFARARLRVDAGADLLLLDEPTAHLDSASAAIIHRMIATLPSGSTVVLASHDREVNELADNRVRIGAASEFRDIEPVAAQQAAPAGHGDAGALEPARASGSSSTARALLRLLRPASKRYLAAVALGTLAVLFAISMTTVSGWLIVKASEHPSIMYLSVAIVGVRFFGIGRSALRYAERLVTHDAVLESVTWLRLTLWGSLVTRGATSRKLLAGASVVDNLVGAADRVRDLAPRVVIPVAVAMVTSGAAIVGVGMLDSAALPLMLACVLICLVAAPFVTRIADRAASAGQQKLQSGVLRQFAAMLGATADLRANGVGWRFRGELAANDHAAGRDARRASRALGLGSAVVVFSCSATAVLTFVISAPQVRGGTLPIEIVAVLAFLPLALVECFLASAEAVQQWPALSYQLKRIEGVVANHRTPEADRGGELGGVQAITLDGMDIRWPDAARTAVSGVSMRVDRGQWVVVEGPSGSGKSTLLTALLGYLRPSRGTYRVNDIDTLALGGRALRTRIAWAPQDGYLFDSTLRANLILARSREDAPTDGEMVSALERVGLGNLVDGLSNGLDTAVGTGGSHLSGGQRQRVVVARTLLTRADVILLDEPTAHLDGDAAGELMMDLRRALTDRLVVLVTHHSKERELSDAHVELSANGQCRLQAAAAPVYPA